MSGNQANQANPSDPDEVNRQALHKARIIQEDRDRKKNSVVVKQWIRIITDHQHPKGGKVRLCKKMKNGNVHSLYLGREKRLQDVLARYKAKGLKVE